MKIKYINILLFYSLMALFFFSCVYVRSNESQCNCKANSCGEIQHVNANYIVDLFKEDKFIESPTYKTNFPIHWTIRNEENDSLAIKNIEDALFGTAIAEIDERDDDGMTPLITAIACGRKSIVETLINRGATVTIPLRIKTDTGVVWEVSPLLYSVIKGRKPCLDVLISRL